MQNLKSGLWPILATPFSAAGDVDEASLAAEVRFLAEAGADGLVALGVFGEGTNLTLAEQARVVAGVAEAAEGLPLVVGTSGKSTRVVLEQLGAAASSGAELFAAMVQINSTSVDLVRQHLAAINSATGLPIVVQDYPVASGVTVSAQAVREMTDESIVAAVKAETPPTTAVVRLFADTDTPVFGGLGGVGLVDELDAGSAGAMTGFSCPEGLRAIIDAHAAGGFAAARAEWANWAPLASFEFQPRIALGIRKYALYLRGVFACPDVRPPAAAIPHDLIEPLRRHLAATPLQIN